MVEYGERTILLSLTRQSSKHYGERTIATHMLGMLCWLRTLIEEKKAGICESVLGVPRSAMVGCGDDVGQGVWEGYVAAAQGYDVAGVNRTRGSQLVLGR